MVDETSPSSTGGTTTTTETTTAPAGGSGTGTGQTNDGGLAAALGDGTGKTPAEVKSGDTPPKPEDKAPSGAPEKYEAWKVPEGYELDAGLVEEASPIFRELGLSQEQTQKLVDFYSKHSIKSAEDLRKAGQDAYRDMRTEWRESMLSDEVLGKLTDKAGKHGPDSPLVVTVNRALDSLQNPKLVSDFKAAMDLTGAGDHPAFVRVLHALASKVTEGTSYAAGGPVKEAGKRPSPAAAMYPHLPSGSS